MKPPKASTASSDSCPYREFPTLCTCSSAMPKPLVQRWRTDPISGRAHLLTRSRLRCPPQAHRSGELLVVVVAVRVARCRVVSIKVVEIAISRLVTVNGARHDPSGCRRVKEERFVHERVLAG